MVQQAVTPLPYILGHIVEYEDAQGMRCIDLCNHATVLVTDMFLMGKQALY